MIGPAQVADGARDVERVSPRHMWVAAPPIPGALTRSGRQDCHLRGHPT